MKIYMVEEITWDGNVTICCFSTTEKAIEYCNKHCGFYVKDLNSWKNGLALYEIVEYEVDANSG